VHHSLSLPKASGSAAAARRFLECVRDQVSERTLENARLLVSELVANAIEHVREKGEIELRVSLARGILRVEVLDRGPGFIPRQRSPDSDRGWGLQYVDRLATSWGVDREDERSRVWFELLSET
jgi:anti-sigma regulatory factor (Ser/Thr protein kinase)